MRKIISFFLLSKSQFSWGKVWFYLFYLVCINNINFSHFLIFACFFCLFVFTYYSHEYHVGLASLVVKVEHGDYYPFMVLWNCSASPLQVGWYTLVSMINLFFSFHFSINHISHYSNIMNVSGLLWLHYLFFQKIQIIYCIFLKFIFQGQSVMTEPSIR